MGKKLKSHVTRSEIIVKGKVQKATFRSYVKDLAKKYKLFGFKSLVLLKENLKMAEEEIPTWLNIIKMLRNPLTLVLIGILSSIIASLWIKERLFSQFITLYIMIWCIFIITIVASFFVYYEHEKNKSRMTRLGYLFSLSLLLLIFFVATWYCKNLPQKEFSHDIECEDCKLKDLKEEFILRPEGTILNISGELDSPSGILEIDLEENLSVFSKYPYSLEKKSNLEYRFNLSDEEFEGIIIKSDSAFTQFRLGPGPELTKYGEIKVYIIFSKELFSIRKEKINVWQGKLEETPSGFFIIENEEGDNDYYVSFIPLYNILELVNEISTILATGVIIGFIIEFFGRERRCD